MVSQLSLLVVLPIPLLSSFLFKFQNFFPKATANVVSSVVLGQRFSYSDKTFSEILQNMNRNFKLLNAGGVVLFFPLLSYLPITSKFVEEFGVNLKMNFDFVAGIIEEHKVNFDYENPKDFIDACLKEIEDRKADGSDTSALAENNLAVTILNLFAAGKYLSE